MALDLTKRSELARGLTNAEQDANLTALETFINGLLSGTAGYEAGNALKLGGVLASLYALKTGNGGGAFATGPLTVTGAITTSSDISCSADALFYSYNGGAAGTVRAGFLAVGSGQEARVYTAGINRLVVDASGNVLPAANGTQTLGSTSLRYAQVWCTAGAFNSSDARLKTAVRGLTNAEIAAAQELAAEIGFFQWLDAVENKGIDKARWHAGLTVQRAIEIMIKHELDPFAYGFIGYDKWEDTIVKHPAIDAVDPQPAQLAEYETQVVVEPAIVDGKEVILQIPRLVCVKEAIPAIGGAEAKEAWDEVTLAAGDAFSFRYDELNQFIHAGVYAGALAQNDKFEHRIAELESKIHVGGETPV